MAKKGRRLSATRQEEGSQLQQQREVSMPLIRIPMIPDQNSAVAARADSFPEGVAATAAFRRRRRQRTAVASLSSSSSSSSSLSSGLQRLVLPILVLSAATTLFDSSVVHGLVSVSSASSGNRFYRGRAFRFHHSFPPIFQSRRSCRRYHHHHRRGSTGAASASSSSALSATRDKKAEEQQRKAASETSTTSWSSASGNGSGSRFGVRKRVRAVLAKAKNRTGRSNGASFDNENWNDTQERPEPSSAGSVIADAASIGAFGGEADLIFSSTAVRNDKKLVQKKDDVTDGLAVAEQQGEESNEEETVNGNAAASSSQKTTKPPTATATTMITKAKPPATTAPNMPPIDVDVALLADAVSIDPLPFTLPKLSENQLARLEQGERIQEQSKMGREGSGYVVMDIKAPPHVVWEVLLDFEKYPENIGTVRSMTMFTNTHPKWGYTSEIPVSTSKTKTKGNRPTLPARQYGRASITRAAFVLSKFRLKIAAIHDYRPHPSGHHMIFTLDKANKNMVLQDAKGTWFTERVQYPVNNGDDEGGTVTRVWLLCSLKVSRILPRTIVDYAAKRAMPRATKWLRPTVERAMANLEGGSEGINGDGRSDINNGSSSGNNGSGSYNGVNGGGTASP